MNLKGSDKVWYERGYSLDQLGNHQDAIGCYNMGLELNPKNLEILMWKGVALRKLGKWKQACRIFDEVEGKGFSSEIIQSEKRQIQILKRRLGLLD